MTTSYLSKSSLFRAFNAAKSRARRDEAKFSPLQANRILSLLQRGDVRVEWEHGVVVVIAPASSGGAAVAGVVYRATVARCQCEHYQRTRGWCAHRLAAAAVEWDWRH